MIDPVRGEARALLAGALRPDDRVLITGAAGWFGLTLAALLEGTGHPVLLVTQRPRRVSFAVGEADAVEWDLGAIRDFAPTIVVDCAFILRDYIGDMSAEHYVSENTALTSRLLQLTTLESTRAVISVSSGAAVHPDDAAGVDVAANPYGYLKRQAELAVLRLGEDTGTRVLVARPWSLSGGLVTRPSRYAFSDLVQQAGTGTLRVAAPHEVWRRYVGVDDFFAVAFHALAGSMPVINSGGELVEFGDLAGMVAALLGGTVTRAGRSDAPADDYYARDTTWVDACAAAGFAPASIEQQVLDVDRALRALT